MHIILEGSDKVGKTTLAVELAKRLKMPIINRLKVRDTIYDECVDFLTNSSQGYIVDRFHISELAYGPVKRGEVRLNDKELLTIEELCSLNKTVNIYCYDSLAKIKERCVAMNEDFIVGDEIDRVVLNFNKEINNSNLLWHRYAIGDDIDEVAEMIKTHFAVNDIQINDNY